MALERDHRAVRSWLFVPGDSERKLERCWTSGADAVIVDLEDAVAIGRKAAARTLAVAAIRGAPRGDALVAIRLNAVASGLARDDLDATFACRPDAYVLPKVRSADDIREVASWIADLEAQHDVAAGTVRLLAIVTEHPAAVLALDALCGADLRLASVMWGAEDLRAELGARRVRDDRGKLLDVFRTVRSLALLAACAHGLAAVDAPVVELGAEALVEAEAREAAAMGFTGKAAIHPDQIAPIHRGFAPTADEATWARELLAAAAASQGAFRFRGAMVDAAHVAAARRMLARATPNGEGRP
jgi:citrate lyase subunit beta/citryl-CoA lyase